MPEPDVLALDPREFIAWCRENTNHPWSSPTTWTRLKEMANTVNGAPTAWELCEIAELRLDLAEARAQVAERDATILRMKSESLPAAVAGQTPCEEEDNQVVWLVESRPSGTFEGWWSDPPKGEGGWLTTDPNKARRYTEPEARAVAIALSYFPSPFRWSIWMPTEHVFLSSSAVRL